MSEEKTEVVTPEQKFKDLYTKLVETVNMSIEIKANMRGIKYAFGWSDEDADKILGVKFYVK